MNLQDRETRDAVSYIKLMLKTANATQHKLGQLMEEDLDYHEVPTYNLHAILDQDQMEVLSKIKWAAWDAAAFYRGALAWARKMDIPGPTFIGDCNLPHEGEWGGEKFGANRCHWIGAYWWGQRWDVYDHHPSWIQHDHRTLVIRGADEVHCVETRDRYDVTRSTPWGQLARHLIGELDK